MSCVYTLKDLPCNYISLFCTMNNKNLILTLTTLLILAVLLICCLSGSVFALLWIHENQPRYTPTISTNSVVNPLPISYSIPQTQSDTSTSTSYYSTASTSILDLKTVHKTSNIDFDISGNNPFVYIADDKELYIGATMTSGVNKSKLTSTDGKVSDFRVSNDQTKVAFLTYTGEIYIIDLKAKTQTLIFNLNEESYSGAITLGAFDPVAFNILIGYNGVGILNIESNKLTVIDSDPTCSLIDST